VEAGRFGPISRREVPAPRSAPHLGDPLFEAFDRDRSPADRGDARDG
jgi:hypothetical protein